MQIDFVVHKYSCVEDERLRLPRAFFGKVIAERGLLLTWLWTEECTLWRMWQKFKSISR